MTELTLDAKQLPRVTFPKAKVLPPEIAKFKNLKHLVIKAGQLGALCPELAQLKALETLEISNCDFALDLGPGLARLPRLTRLELYNVGITTPVPLPPSLEVLSLEANDRLELPRWIEALTALPKLRELSLANAVSGELPGGLEKLSALRTLVLRQNNFGTCPPALARVSALEELDLSACGLTTLPEELRSLTALHTLTAWGNAFSQVPEVLRAWPLRSLRLSRNPLRDVPDWFGELPLESLDLSEVPLTDLPPVLSRSTLKELWVDVPAPVLTALEQRYASCKVVSRKTADAENEVKAWMRFFRKH